MTGAIQTIDETIRPIDTATEDAASATMRRAGARLKAPATEVELVLAVLFGEVQS